MSKYFVIILSLTIIVSCFKNSIGLLDINVSPPLELVCYSSNSSIIINFWGNNREADFSGYNVYVSTNALDPSLNVSNRIGSNPTIPKSIVNNYSMVSYKITKFHNNNSFVVGETYYVAVKAKVAGAIVGIVYSTYSNVANVTIATTGNSTLNNENIGIANDAIEFNTSGASIVDHPNDPCNIFFELKNSNGSYYPYITTLSDYIQDLGYYSSILDRPDVPLYNNGYHSNSVSVPLETGHIYAIYDTSDNIYIKVYINSKPSVQVISNTNVNVNLDWSVQTVVDNPFF